VAFPFLIPINYQRPRLACDLTTDGVVAGRLADAQQTTTAFAPLFNGALLPSLKTPNIIDKAAVTAALKRALDTVDSRDKRLTLIVPDAAARVLLLDFDTLPAKSSEAVPVVRFRLRKLVPFEVDDAAISYQVMQHTAAETRLLVTTMPHGVLAEYEEVVRLAGYEPGVVLPSTLASLAALTQSGPALLVNLNGNSVTTAINRGDELLLHRSIDLPIDEIPREEELRHAVSVSVAYFEDTLSSMPDAVFYAGPGGAPELSRVLEQEQFRIRDLVSAAVAGNGNSVPQGLLGGVTGALAS